MPVVNEQEIPLFCEGFKSLVVAVSPDGIVICGKEHSETIRGYVPCLVQHPKYKGCRWDSCRVLDTVSNHDGADSLIKSLIRKVDKSISCQIHHHRYEVWTIVDVLGGDILYGAR